MKTLEFLVLICFASVAYAGEPTQSTRYFPIIKDGQNGNGLSDFDAQWFSKSLTRMNEPTLWPAEKKPFTLRLLILPTFGNPVSVRVNKTGKSYVLRTRRLDGKGGYDPGKLVEEKQASLAEADAKEFDQLLNALAFFNLPAEVNDGGMDGEEWILEGVRDGTYHIAVRWSIDYHPDLRGLQPFVALCDFLITKSKLAHRPEQLGQEILPKAKP